MKFTETKIRGVFLITLEKKTDKRGFLARMWDFAAFRKRGINFNILQGYLVRTEKRGTMRGIHYLNVAEKKLTKITRGSFYEVVIDIRPNSKTFGLWQGFTMKDTECKMLFIGQGIAHAILTLEDNTELMSLYSPAYIPGNEEGIRYNDPAFNIKWPIEVKRVSEKDLSWENFRKSKVKSENCKKL